MSEAQLVERFGFTKAAVRAALARLRAEGLLLAEPRRGHVVAPLTMRDVLEIYDLRLALEPPAAEAAAAAMGSAEVARLQALADPEFDVADTKAVERFLAANRDGSPGDRDRSGQSAGGRRSSSDCSTTASAHASSPCARARPAPGAGRAPSCTPCSTQSATATVRARVS